MTLQFSMWFDLPMEQKTTHTNDNFDTWQPLSLATERLLGIHEKQNEGGEGNADAGSTDEQRANDHRRYVDQRLRETAEFERRVSGIKKRKV